MYVNTFESVLTLDVKIESTNLSLSKANTNGEMKLRKYCEPSVNMKFAFNHPSYSNLFAIHPWHAITDDENTVNKSAS